MDRKSVSRPWFAVKSHGYGSGLPIRWQGWACLVAFFAIAVLLPLMIDERIALAIIALLAVGFVKLSQIKSDAPWRWRRGERR